MQSAGLSFVIDLDVVNSFLTFDESARAGDQGDFHGMSPRR